MCESTGGAGAWEPAALTSIWVPVQPRVKSPRPWHMGVLCSSRTTGHRDHWGIPEGAQCRQRVANIGSGTFTWQEGPTPRSCPPIPCCFLFQSCTPTSGRKPKPCSGLFLSVLGMDGAVEEPCAPGFLARWITDREPLWCEALWIA